ncbi:hypothetical protein GCM10022225_20540 [Plantactinospora mayteni]|uniref:Uncharacterized protein n=1 Tax=Plantactinospora mayteni TaxID=566021 RepID=A0ABQ4ENL8_9ACTN|nr:hypothetical protein [Plantactinospora mayteni]GIG96235.1 hypothetical protein Pma05_28080 [Plantactinospora mayteni]
MDRPGVAILLVGVAFGLFVGAAYAVARRAWADYRKARASLSGLRKTAWTVTRIATSRGGIVLLICLAAVGWAAVGGEH